jgi:prophage antirepressor-like protein
MQKKSKENLPCVVPFNFEAKQIRVIHEPDQSLWFVAKDVCEVLGYQNPSKTLSDHLDDDERSNVSLGRQGSTNVISESGLYTLIIRSNKPQAKPFRKWVTSEVLPAIRKTGCYSTRHDKPAQQSLPMPPKDAVVFPREKWNDLNRRIHALSQELKTIGQDFWPGIQPATVSHAVTGEVVSRPKTKEAPKRENDIPVTNFGLFNQRPWEAARRMHPELYAQLEAKYAELDKEKHRGIESMRDSIFFVTEEFGVLLDYIALRIPLILEGILKLQLAALGHGIVFEELDKLYDLRKLPSIKRNV